MATLLYRLGRFSYRRAWAVIAVWFLILAAIVGGAVALGGKTAESFAIPGTESQEALDRLEAVFPSVAGASAQVVNEVPEGASVDDKTYMDAIKEQARAIEKIDGVDTVISPFSEYAGNAISKDDGMALTKVQFSGPSTDVTDKMLDELTASASLTRDVGMTTEFGGQVFQDSTFGITITEVFGIVFAGIVLFITFGSLAAAGMPLLSALIGVGVVYGGISALSAFTSITSTAPMLALMIGLAVGIDYALFILSRHRNQLAKGEDPEESAAMAVGTAGSAVVFAGLTVIIALLGLLVVGIPFLSTMGIAAAFSVLVAIGVAVTLLPAFLGVYKHRLAPKVGSRAYRRANSNSDKNPTMGMRWVKIVMKAPLAFVLGVVVLLGVVAIPALSLQLNLPDNGSEPAASTQRKAYDLVSKGFGPGYNGVLVVAVDITQTVDVLDDLDGIRADLEKVDGVDYVSQGIPDETLDTAILQVVATTAPDSVETKELVQKIRDLAPTIEKQYDTPVSVTGSTAVGIDISNRLTNALIPFGLVVVGLSVILLMMVFRSILVPIKAAIGFLLSVVASFGIIVAVFQWGWFAELLHIDRPGPIISFLPILLMAMLFGLAMDYEVFLVSGMREEFVKTGDARFAVSHGFANGARVVTAAALIMFFVFFAFVPEGSGAIKPIALGLAAGIAIDAFLIRMTLVPAVMTLLGKNAWWIPAWLSKILPNVDVEGEDLRAHRSAVEWTDGQGAAAVSTEQFVAGGTEGDADAGVGPLTVTVPVGALAIVSGETADRRELAAALSGRLETVSGRAQVGGYPLPSEASRVRGLVALADISGLERSETTVTVGELLAERLEMTQPWYRMWSTSRSSRAWLDRINSVVAQVAPGSRPNVAVLARSTLLELPQLERAIALTALALAEDTRIVMLDQLDPFADETESVAYLRALDLLAPPSTTIFLGTPLAASATGSGPVHATGTNRATLSIDLYRAAAETATTGAKGGNA